MSANSFLIEMCCVAFIGIPATGQDLSSFCAFEFQIKRAGLNSSLAQLTLFDPAGTELSRSSVKDGVIRICDLPPGKHRVEIMWEPRCGPIVIENLEFLVGVTQVFRIDTPVCERFGSPYLAGCIHLLRLRDVAGRAVRNATVRSEGGGPVGVSDQYGRVLISMKSGLEGAFFIESASSGSARVTHSCKVPEFVDRTVVLRPSPQ